MTSLSLPDGYTLHAPGLQLQQHVFGDPVMIPADISVSGYEQKEKTCRNCGAVRVTVLAPVYPYREWRWSADGPQILQVPACPPAPEFKR